MFKKAIKPILLSIIFIGITVLFYSNFSLYKNYYFDSKKYKIETNYIYNVSSNTTKELYQKYFDITNYNLKIDTNNEYISNGTQTILLDQNNKLISTFINIVKGDIVSDGIINNDDIAKFEQYFTNNYQLKEYEIKCLDINDDNNITREDLELLKTTINEGIKAIDLTEEQLTLQINEKYRLVPIVTPSYGINTNLIFTSNNETIASIDDSGLITPKQLGNTTITITDISKKIEKNINITVDNTIKLSSNEGVLFLDTKETLIKIISKDYENIKCQSSNNTIATCHIDNDNLYIKPLSKGDATITVTSPKYGTTTYNLKVYKNYLDFIPEYHCMPKNKREIINLDYPYDDITISNNKLTTNTHIKNNQLYLESLNEIGREELIITDNNTRAKLTIDIYNLNIPSIGAFIKPGETKSANIVAENTNKLSCTSTNNSKATCYIENNQLYVTGISPGEVNLTITNTNTYNNKEYECGTTNFLAVITK